MTNRRRFCYEFSNCEEEENDRRKMFCNAVNEQCKLLQEETKKLDKINDEIGELNNRIFKLKQTVKINREYSTEYSHNYVLPSLDQSTFNEYCKNDYNNQDYLADTTVLVDYVWYPPWALAYLKCYNGLLSQIEPLEKKLEDKWKEWDTQNYEVKSRERRVKNAIDNYYKNIEHFG